MSCKLNFFVTVLAVLLLLSATYVLYMEEQGNFHPITEGEGYRSGLAAAMWKVIVDNEPKSVAKDNYQSCMDISLYAAPLLWTGFLRNGLWKIETIL